MQMLNRYFTPFALILILSAIFFSEPEPKAYWMSLSILAISTLVNWWLARNSYRFIHWVRQMRTVQVWLNFLWSVPLFYLLQQFWGPMWLLFMMAPVTAALYMGRWQTFGTAMVSALTMLGIYYSRGVFDSPQAGGQALVHASFIVIFALFVRALAQNALRLRDAGLGA